MIRQRRLARFESDIFRIGPAQRGELNPCGGTFRAFTDSGVDALQEVVEGRDPFGEVRDAVLEPLQGARNCCRWAPVVGGSMLRSPSNRFV